MLFKNVEVHNVAALLPSENGVTWLRFPESACEHLEQDWKKAVVSNATGVELRFVMHSDTVQIHLQAIDPTSAKIVTTCQVYRGQIQGGWEDHEIDKTIGAEETVLTIKKSQNAALLHRMSEHAKHAWDPEVVRLIFNHGHIRLLDIVGDVEPPKSEQMPQKTLMAYGSSITHGSNAYSAPTTWVSTLAHRLNMDTRNMGMAGSCSMEPAIIDYLASEGERGNWDLITLELGINVLGWPDEKIVERVTNAVRQVGGRNPDKPVLVISPFYCCVDFNGDDTANKWRRMMKDIVEREGLSNVHYISGLDILDDMALISADDTHPNIHGIAQIADRLYAYITEHKLV